MKDQLSMFDQMTCADTPSAIGLRALQSGLTPCGLQDGPMTAPSGPDHAHASLFQAPVPEKGPMTPATCGPSGSTLSASAALQRFLESRLKQRLSTDGLILYRATWKTRVTPAGRSVCLLALSVPRTSDNGCGLWQTISTRPPMTLTDAAVHLSAWATPLCNDARGSAYSKSRSGTILKLTGQARLAMWPTPTAKTAAGGEYKDPQKALARVLGPHANDLRDFAKLTQSSPARITVSGQMLTGCTAETKNGGQLNPAHSRWLMGLPSSWDQEAPGKVKAVRGC